MLESFDGLPKLVAFGGYATAGKDAAANSLVIHNNFYKTYMSKPLEKALLTLDPIVNRSGLRYQELHSLVGYDESKKVPEVRRLLQKLGTEFGREMVHEDFWLNKVFDEVLEQNVQQRNVALTGIRYTNELARVENYGGLSIWIDRPRVAPVNSHTSDNTLWPDDFDVRVDNDGSLEDLHKRVLEVLTGHAHLPLDVPDVKPWEPNYTKLMESISREEWSKLNPAFGITVNPVDPNLIQDSMILVSEEAFVEESEKASEILECNFSGAYWSGKGFHFVCDTHGRTVTSREDVKPDECSAVLD